MEKISPRVDVAFKKIFGVEENKDLLISFINSIVGKEDQVLDITLLNPYNPKNFRQDKLSILTGLTVKDLILRFKLVMKLIMINEPCTTGQNYIPSS